MITIRFTQPGYKFQGVYTLPVHMVDQAKAFLLHRGYKITEYSAS